MAGNNPGRTDLSMASTALGGAPARGVDLAESYRYCRRVSRGAASNFYWSFRLLPRQKRDAMYALYAFARQTDDLGDREGDVHARRESLQAWRGTLEEALAGKPRGTLWPALADAVARFKIDHRHLFDLIDGVAMDVDWQGFERFADLRKYCYRVATSVGLACLSIWGYRDERAMTLADSCGTALQLTNILRDLPEDAARGRVYLPREDLRQFDCTEQDVLDGVVDERAIRLVRFEVDRARSLFREAESILPFLYADGRRACWLMLATYRTLLDQIDREPGRIWQRRPRLTKRKKIQLALRLLVSGGCRLPRNEGNGSR